jgi:hypothetical protein
MAYQGTRSAPRVRFLQPGCHADAGHRVIIGAI